MTAHHGGHAGGVNAMAAAATLHCLTGCAIGEILGMVLATAFGWGNALSIVVSIALAFGFGYSLSTLPLLAAGLPASRALRVVLAADTLSIVTMEIVDNLVVVVVPGALDATLADVLFWLSLALSLVVAFGAAFPVNRLLLLRGKGHALTHEFHGAPPARNIPVPSTNGLALTIGAGLAVGAVVAAFV